MDRRKRESEKVKEGDKSWMNANKLKSREREGGEQFGRYEEVLQPQESQTHAHAQKHYKSL